MQVKIKVGFVITKGIWGGAGRYVYDLATSLPKNTYDVFVITGQGETLKQKLKEKNIKTYKLPYLQRDISLWRELKSSLVMLRIIRRERPDVLHLNSPKAAGFGSVAGRLIGIKKIIMTVHGWTFNEDRNQITKGMIMFFSWLTALLCHKVVVIAEKEKKQALCMPFAKNKIVLIRNGIEKINFKDRGMARTELNKRLRLSLTPDTPWFVTIAELHKNKGLQYSISAVDKINWPFAYFIIGEGDERKNLEKLIKEKFLIDEVFLLGSIENAKEYLKAFDVFLLPSIKEGLPYTILEAGQAGLPVIATNVGGISDIIDNNKNGILVPPHRSGDFAGAIESLAVNPDKQKEFGKNLKEKVEKEFSIEEMIRRTTSLYY